MNTRTSAKHQIPPRVTDFCVNYPLRIFARWYAHYRTYHRSRHFFGLFSSFDRLPFERVPTCYQVSRRDTINRINRTYPRHGRIHVSIVVRSVGHETIHKSNRRSDSSRHFYSILWILLYRIYRKTPDTEHTTIILLFVIKIIRKRRVVLLDGPCAVNTMHTSTWERPLCTTTILLHTILPHTVCSFVDFSAVPHLSFTSYGQSLP